MIFYALSAAVSLFCAVALGFGPPAFAVGGVALAAVGFRSRLRRWWGLPLAGAGLGEAIGALAGWTARTVVTASAVLFGLLLAVRLLGHRSDRRRQPAAPPPRRTPGGGNRRYQGWDQ